MGRDNCWKASISAPDSSAFWLRSSSGDLLLNRLGRNRPEQPLPRRFGVLVLGPKVTPPGILYPPRRLELNFYATGAPPLLYRLVPPAADATDLPGKVTAVYSRRWPCTTGRYPAVHP